MVDAGGRGLSVVLDAAETALTGRRSVPVTPPIGTRTIPIPVPAAPAGDRFDEDRVGLDHLSLAVPAVSDLHDAVASAAGRGAWTLLRAPEPVRAAVRVVPPEAEALARITRRVKAALDPSGILNPGRIYAGL